jgi:hypothetical protein
MSSYPVFPEKKQKRKAEVEIENFKGPPDSVFLFFLFYSIAND